MIVLPADYGWPLLSVMSTFWLLAFQTMKVGRARKAAGIPYPRAYAEKAELDSGPAPMLFNCAQRAHQNTLEVLPGVIICTLISGLHYPTFAFRACAAWTLFRFIYTLGYTSGDPAQRNFLGANAFSSVATIALLLAATWTAGRTALGIY